MTKIGKLGDMMGHGISRLAYGLRYFFSPVIVIFAYIPFAKIVYLLEKLGLNLSNILLSTYRHMSFYRMRTDALDRFSTRLEQQFIKEQIQKMMETTGLEDIMFSYELPYWCAVGTGKAIMSVDC